MERPALRSEAVGHAQRNNGGPAELKELERVEEVALEVHHIDDDDERLRRLAPRRTVGENPVADRLFWRVRVQRVGARQVEQFNAGRARWEEREVVPEAPLGLGGDARVVARLFTPVGERVEEGRLARVGVAGDRDAQDLVEHRPS